MNRSGSSGYYPGQVTSFTPYRDAKWTEEFNKLLPYYKSRNELTSLLIEEGLKHFNKKHENIIRFEIDAGDLTEEQRKILESPAAKELVKNLVLAMLGKNFNPALIQQISTTPVQQTGNEMNTKEQYDEQKEIVKKPSVLERALKAHKNTNFKA